MREKRKIRGLAWILVLILLCQNQGVSQAAAWRVQGDKQGFQGAMSLFLIQPRAEGEGADAPAGTVHLEAEYTGGDLAIGKAVDKNKVKVTLVTENADGDPTKRILAASEFTVSPAKVTQEGANEFTAKHTAEGTEYTAGFTVNGVRENVDVNFHYGEGQTMVAGEVKKDVTVPVKKGNTLSFSLIPVPVYEGYQFLGWYTEENGGGGLLRQDTRFDADAEYYAYWKKITLISIRAEYHGSYVTVGEDIDKKDITVSGQYTDEQERTFQDDEYTIDNKTITEKGENTRRITAVERTASGGEVSADIVVTGVAKKFTVTFDSNGGSSVISRTVADGGILGSLPTSKKEGYYLEGWYDAGENKVTGMTVVTGDITLHAKWEEIKISEIKASYDGTAIVGGRLDLDHLFVYAYKNDGSSERITDGYTVDAYTIVEGNNKIKVAYGGKTAEFTVKGYVDNVTVTFDSMGGSAVNPITVVRNGTVTPPKTTQSGFVFSGWFTEQGGKGTKLTNKTKITQSTTFYAHWVTKTATSISAYYSGSSSAGTIDVSKVTVTLHYNDGTTETLKSGFSLDKTTLAAGSNSIKVTYNSLTTTIYVYVSHGTLAEITAAYRGNPVKVGDTIKYTDITVTAVYSDHSTSIITSGYTITGGTIKEGDNLYTVSYGGKSVTINIPCVIKYVVSFNSMGGSSIRSVEVTKGQNLGQLVTGSAYTPKYSGYTFLDWYLDKDYGKKATPSTVVTSNLTLYAKWEKFNPYSISDTSMNLKKNEQGVLTVLGLPDSKVVWSSSNDYVAEVNSHGVVTAMEKGTTTITAITSDDYTLSCVVTVGREVSYITTNFTKKTIKKGKSVQLRVKVKPSNAVTKKVKYTSSNKKVATVSSKGKIKAKGKGSCTIYVKTTDSSQIVKKIKIKVV